jgi:hypothetical protein
MIEMGNDADGGDENDVQIRLLKYVPCAPQTGALKCFGPSKKQRSKALARIRPHLQERRHDYLF